MADADVAITAGTGTKIDTRTVGAGTDEHRQVVVVGDPTTAAGVAPVVTSADNIALGAALNANAIALGYDGTNTDLLRVVAALDAAPNVDTGILAIGNGPGWDRKRDPAGVAATSTANAVTVVVDGAAEINFHVTTIGVTPGSMTFEVTGDDTNWITAPNVYKVNTFGAGVQPAAAFVPAVNDIYAVKTGGYRQVRYRVNAVYASGTATVKWTATSTAGIVRTVTQIYDNFGNGPAVVTLPADSLSNADGGLRVLSLDTSYNGTSSDMTRNIASVSAAPNVDTGILAVGIGPGWDRKRTASAMAVTLNAATTLTVNGAAAVMFNLKFNTVTVGTGTLVFEVTADDTNWVTAPTVMQMPAQTAVAGTFAPADGQNYMVGTAGWRQVRVRVAAALTSGTIDVKTTGTAADAILTLADRQRVASYGVVFRLAETTATLSLAFTQVANTTKQWATIHHAATALKLVKIRKVTFWLYSTSAAIDGVLELRRITTAPATGAPAITPAAHDPAAAAAEVTCLALPGTQATEAAVNSPVASIGLNIGITAANTTQTGPIPFLLFDSDKYTDMQALNIRPLTLEGWAVDLRTVGTPAVKATIEVQLTEE